MGTEYKLYKPEKNEFYELGKGAWNESFFGSKNQHVFLSDLLMFLSKTYSDDTPLGYFRWMEKDINLWIGEDHVKFYYEDSFYDETSGLNPKETGTRYKG